MIQVEKTPTRTIAALLRKGLVLPRTDCTPTKDQNWPYEGPFCGIME